MGDSQYITFCLEPVMTVTKTEERTTFMIEFVMRQYYGQGSSQL